MTGNGFLVQGTATVLAVFAMGLYDSGTARGQSGLQIIPLAAPGSSTETGVTLQVGGPTDVLPTELIFQPGGSVGWHMHPGPVVVVIKSGVLTEIEDNGCIVAHPAGTAFFERAGVVHNALNATGGVTDVYATFLSPTGAPPLIPEPDPGSVCPGGAPGTISATIEVNVNSDLNVASQPPASFNIDSQGAMKLAILGSGSYDVTTIDPASVKFGPKGAPNVGTPYFQDVNGDGKPDLILSVVPASSGVGCSDTAVTVTGLTYGTQAWSGSEAIQTTHTFACPR